MLVPQRLFASTRAARLIQGLLLGAAPGSACGVARPPDVELAEHIVPKPVPSSVVSGRPTNTVEPQWRSGAGSQHPPAPSPEPLGPPPRIIPVYGATERRLLFKLEFAPGSHLISTAAATTLEELARVLKENPEIRTEVEGHADSTEKDPAALSGRRAGSVIHRLKALGVDGARLTSRASGAEMPIDTNETAEGRARNRRVVFNIVGER